MSAIQLVHGSVKASTLRAVLSDATEIVVVSAYTTLKGLGAIEHYLLGCTRGAARSSSCSASIAPAWPLQI